MKGPKESAGTKKKTTRSISKEITEKNILRIHTTSAFEKAYRNLNSAQRQAVDTVEGPVMVVAGPGTGKTQVLTLRVANILRRTQMRPSNILCLTFSVSAATEMRDRLRVLIGPDAYGVTVRNFHSFCNELIEDHPLVFGDFGNKTQISDLQRYRLVNKIIDQLLPQMELVNPKYPHIRTTEIIGRISELKREGVVDREKLEAVADNFELSARDVHGKETQAFENKLLQVRKFRDLLTIFFCYQEELENSDRYDYEDMILFVSEALKRHEEFLRSLQERYQYILVDEFQDTNGAQYQLIDVLTTYAEGVQQDPNIFVVGDDDQAIYRFQGANLANILSFHKRFPEASVLPLTVSYRSTQEILDAAGSLISNNSERLVGKLAGLQKNLVSSSARTGESPRLLLTESDRTEPWIIADVIEERIKNGVPAKEIAILVQTNRELAPLAKVLEAQRIPIDVTGSADLLSARLVLEGLTILRAVEKPETDHLLAAALGAEHFAIHPADLGRIFVSSRERKMSIMKLLLELEGSLHRDQGKRKKSTKLVKFSGLKLNDPHKIIRALDRILDLHNKLPSRTVISTVEHVVRECDVLRDRGDMRDFASLQEFFHRVTERSVENPDLTLHELLSDIAYAQHPEYPELRWKAELPHLQKGGVQLMTVHQSKGREFDVVILVNFRAGHWDKRRKPPSISMPEDLLFGWTKEVMVIERAQDERRLCYVAMTRARKELLFTCPRTLTDTDRMRSVSPSVFFAEAGSIHEEEARLKDPEKALTLFAPPLLKVDEQFKAFLEERLQNFTLSATALNHFLEDPKIFLEKDLLQVPTAPEPNLVYGSAVHEALRSWGLSVQRSEPMTGKEFFTAFSDYLDRPAILTDHERRNLLHTAKKSLPRYYRVRLKKHRPFIHKVEYTIRAHMALTPSPYPASGRGEIPLKGKIDRIDLAAPDSARATIIDFKTGRPQTESQIRKGDYFRQLTFYALLLRHSRSILKPEHYVLDFIGEKEQDPVERMFEITESEERQLEALIEAVWGKVVALDFTSL